MTAPKRFIMQLSESDHAKLKRAAALEHLSMSSFVSRLVMSRVDDLLREQTVEPRKHLPAEQPQLVGTTEKDSFDQALAEFTGMRKVVPVAAAEPEPGKREPLDYYAPWPEFYAECQRRGFDEERLQEHCTLWEVKNN